MNKQSAPLDLFGGRASFFTEITAKKYAVYQLVKRDLAERYAGTYLGLFWVITQQVLMLAVMGFVLQVGFRVKPAGELPFLVWMIPAVVMWAFFFEAVTAASNSLVSYAYIVKKIQFKLSILPLVKVLSAGVIHGLFLAVGVAVLMLFGVRPSFAWLQTVYYFFACVCFVLGLGWLLSSVTVFFRDLSAGITIFLNMGMWATPIYWNLDMLPERLRFLAYLNPVCYLTEGYRNSLLYNMPFWNDPLWALYFWAVTLGLLFAGIFIFRKLKPHFADVL